ncbi:MAG: hypothetical protein WD060_05745 [Pirellulales bacterium]
MPRNVIEMTLMPRERSLLLRYGYPFEKIQRELQTRSKSKEIEVVPIVRFELEQLIGNLCYSINRMKPGRLRNELFDICGRLEAAERYGDGGLDVL